MYEELLPQTVLSKASVDGNAWQKNDVEEAILAAKHQKLATVYGDVQFQVRGCVYELYWLSFDPAQQLDSENWQDYVTRSANECISNFNDMCKTTDFVQLGKEYASTIRDVAETEDISVYLWFELGFLTEEKYHKNHPKTKS